MLSTYQLTMRIGRKNDPHHFKEILEVKSRSMIHAIDKAREQCMKVYDTEFVRCLSSCITHEAPRWDKTLGCANEADKAKKEEYRNFW